MFIDATLRSVDAPVFRDLAVRCETLGFDTALTTETNNDPFLGIALAAESTQSIGLGTGIAVAFPRSPMHVAHTSWDLQALSGGRFSLGLGTQVKAHVERRFSATWSSPAPRMREYVLALRAIWEAWETGEDLNFQGEFYSHTLMPPNFRPVDHGHGAPKVMLAGVKEKMIEVAGEVADVLLIHALQSPEVVRDYILPAVERGAERGGRSRADVQLSLGLFTATTDEGAERIRRRIGFYGSTPGYRHVLDAHGLGDLHEKLHALSRSGGWAEMTGLVSDEVLDLFAVRGADDDAVAAEVGRRYGGLVDRISIGAEEASDLDALSATAAALRRVV
jgi:probable F420-dependent oxidoreductase